ALGHPAQELRTGLPEHGRRPQLRRGRRLAHGRDQLHGSAVRGQGRARPRSGRSGLRRGSRHNGSRQQGLGHRLDRRGAVGDPPAGHAGLPDPDARHPSIPPERWHRRASDARVADELLMFAKVLVANRGAVAARVLRALDALGVPSVAVYSDADADAPYLETAGQAIRIGAAASRESYLDQAALLEAMRRSGADAVHPGYGFLSENADFARSVEQSGLCFIGPSAHWIESMGHKTRARAIAAEHGLPVSRGSQVLGADVAAITRAADEIGYPVLVKPAAGGGGIGMLPARSRAELLPAVERASSMAMRGFANGDVYLERLVERPRHIEFQLLGDRHGHLRHLFERDCSVQRRHQKIIEEAPAPGVDRAAVDALAASVAAVMGRLGYD